MDRMNRAELGTQIPPKNYGDALILVAFTANVDLRFLVDASND
jgi:hypothetical protein